MAIPVPRRTTWRKRQEAVHNCAVEVEQGQVRDSSPSSVSEGSRSFSSDSSLNEDNDIDKARNNTKIYETESESINNSEDEGDRGQDVDRDEDVHEPNSCDGDDLQDVVPEDNEDFDAEPEVAQYTDGFSQANDEVERGPLLYQGCPLSTMESDILIMSFVVRWGLKDKSIEDFLQLIDCHLPCSAMKTKLFFLERFPVPDLKRSGSCALGAPIFCQGILSRETVRVVKNFLSIVS